MARVGKKNQRGLILNNPGLRQRKSLNLNNFGGSQRDDIVYNTCGCACSWVGGGLCDNFPNPGCYSRYEHSNYCGYLADGTPNDTDLSYCQMGYADSGEEQTGADCDCEHSGDYGVCFQFCFDDCWARNECGTGRYPCDEVHHPTGPSPDIQRKGGKIRRRRR